MWIEGHAEGYKWIPSGYHNPHISIEQILADHFGIDRKKLEDEKHQMLEQLREINGLK